MVLFSIPFQLDKSGQVTVAFMAFVFKAQRSQGDFFFNWESKDISLFYDKQACTLNEETYATVRPAVTDKLGDRRKTFIMELEI